MNNNHRSQNPTARNYPMVSEFVPTHWQAGTVVAEDNTSLHYTRTGGDKPRLVLLHGVQVSSLSWTRTAQALEAAYDVVMPDFRGHGRSGRIEGDVSAKTLVDDIIVVINALELESPFVIGHSMGADIAGRLAAVYPLRAVVLVDPALQHFPAAALMDTDAPPVWMQGLLDTLQSLKILPHAERMLAGLRLLPPGHTIDNPVDYVCFVEGQAQFDTNFFRSMHKIGYLFEDTDTIRQNTCPMLLLTARPTMPGANIEAGVAAFTQNWNGSRHIHFDDSGHAIMFDQFERFVEVVTDFLETVGQ
ncbi:MAG: alpha/beta hydrolase [Chloroflexi bacterium]|nr:MAG: alpha/beta hydrolase [Chloroflexota bacterium]